MNPAGASMDSPSLEPSPPPVLEGLRSRLPAEAGSAGGGRRPPSTFFVARWLFLRALGLIYLLTFLTLAPQIDGLLGSAGLLPAAAHLWQTGASLGGEGVLTLPSLLWLRPDSGFLHVLITSGVGASCLLLAGAAPRLASGLCWILYLSIVAVGRDFFVYQWDALLLEAGLLAVIFAPGGLWPGIHQRAPSAWSLVWLGRLLLVKVLAGSALGAMWGGEEARRGLGLLVRHFESQPLPTLMAWWAHQLPGWLHELTGMLLLVLLWLAAVLAFAPRRLAAWAAAGTGFGFGCLSMAGYPWMVSLLVLALCLLLVDDATWERLRNGLSGRLQDQGMRAMLQAKPMWRVASHGMAASTLAILSLLAGLEAVIPRAWLGAPPRLMLDALAPLRSFNSYALLTGNTPVRYEIVIEGSLDGERWVPYEFRSKPGDPWRRPGLVPSFQPRLDWQMGVEASRVNVGSPWFESLLDHLLRGEPATLDLLDRNPFPLWPPRTVRATLYRYRFTSVVERRQTGRWWQREAVRLLVPARLLPAEERRPPLPRGVHLI